MTTPMTDNARIDEGKLTYARIIEIVDDCSERMKRTGESHRMMAKWISEGINAALARRSIQEQPEAVGKDQIPRKQQADAYLEALLNYSGGFYGVAIKAGLPAVETVGPIAHIERAARELHRLAVAASAVPDNTDARGAQVSVRDAGGLREELRLLATAQPLSGERSTYSDGFANGLFHAIERLDRALDPVKAPKP